MDIYREIILDHYKHPRNFGHLSHVDARSQAENITCGDHLEMELCFSENRNTIEQVAFSGVGCAISLASASLLTEEIRGMSIKQILDITSDHIIELLGTPLTPSRAKCALLSLEVLHKAIQPKK